MDFDFLKTKKVLLDFKNQLLFTPKINFFKKNDLIKFRKSEKFVLIAMGGSHLAMDLLKILDFKKEIKIYSNYELPESELSKKNFFILSSYSGNTDEVIYNFYKLLKRKNNFLIITSNGDLLKLALENKKPFIKLPKADDLMPRFALGYFLKVYAYLIKSSLNLELEKIASKINFDFFEKQAKKMVQKIKEDEILIFYSNFLYLNLAYHFKIKVNETAKWPAFYNFLPEAHHNEIISFLKKGRFRIYFILDNLDNKSNLKKIEILKDVLKFNKKVNYEEINLIGQNKLEKIINNVVLADWFSLYLAIKNKVSPWEINFIDELKYRFLKKNDKKTNN